MVVLEKEGSKTFTLHLIRFNKRLFSLDRKTIIEHGTYENCIDVPLYN